MGHTRWRTRGSETNSRNNHPIRAGIITGTHNGTIYNADYLFRRLAGVPGLGA
jgi:glucosamine 6-phosphate synthetase-like amidotransferase/phosphosugar isomerase protein